jgi:regulator of cell morphogenesis and NO signaling
MELFHKETKLTDLVNSNYLLLPVINRFGIRLGFGDKTVGELCLEKGIELDFFLAIINTFNNYNYFPEDELRSFSASLIVDYLKKSHHDFLKFRLPKIERVLSRLIGNSDSEDLKIIQTFYNKYKTDLVTHIKDEEENTFPYLLQLQKIHDSGAKQLPASLLTYTIHSFEKEHTNVDEKLFDLKNIIIKYLPPQYDDVDCNEFLFELFEFERDLTDHARIEDNILVPMAMAMEKSLKHG